MSESQSRYSIVERLTSRKLDLITAKSEVSKKILEQKQCIKDYELKLDQYKDNRDSELEAYKLKFANDTKSAQQTMEQELGNLRNELDILEANKSDKIATYEDKLQAIDDALDKIMLISKEAEKD